MSRQERVDVSCAVGIVAILLILLGSWIQSSLQPASASEPPAAPVTAQQPAITAPAATLHSDSPTVATVAAPPAPAPVAAMPATIEPEPAAPATPATCDDCDSDEGEQIDPAELAEIAASLPPCAEEDSEGAECYWDAQQRGNGLGQSFIWDGAEVVYISN